MKFRSRHSFLLLFAVSLTAIVSVGADGCSKSTVPGRVDALKTRFKNERDAYVRFETVMREPETTLVHNRNWEVLSDAFLDWSEALSLLAKDSKVLADQYASLSVEGRNMYKAKVQELDYSWFRPLFARTVNFTIAYEGWTYPLVAPELQYRSTDFPEWTGRPVFNVQMLRRDYRSLYAFEPASVSWTTNLVEDTDQAGLAPAVMASWRSSHLPLICRGSYLTCSLRTGQRTSLMSHLSRFVRPEPPLWGFSETSVFPFQFLKADTSENVLRYGEHISLQYIGETLGVLPLYVVAEASSSGFALVLRETPNSSVLNEWQMLPIWDRALRRVNRDEDAELETMEVQASQTFGLFNVRAQRFVVDCPRSSSGLAWYVGSDHAETSLDELSRCATALY